MKLDLIMQAPLCYPWARVARIYGGPMSFVICGGPMSFVICGGPMSFVICGGPMSFVICGGPMRRPSAHRVYGEARAPCRKSCSGRRKFN